MGEWGAACRGLSTAGESEEKVEYSLIDLALKNWTEFTILLRCRRFQREEDRGEKSDGFFSFF